MHLRILKSCKFYEQDATKRLIIVLSFFWLGGIFLSGCGASSPSEVNPIQSQLISQIEESCQQAKSYTKAIYDLTQFAPEGEDSVYAPIPMVGFGSDQSGKDSLNYLLIQDLEYAFGSFYSDPAIVDQYEVEEKGDTLSATLKADVQAELQSQVIVSSPASSIITYFESHQEKSSWLYLMEIHLKISFDSIGRYREHMLEVKTSVPFVGATFHAMINGTNQYP